MSLKPILFDTEMVRALLEGRKTVTRRVVKPQPNGNGMEKMPDDSGWPGYWAEVGSLRVINPPYKPSDVLYVRETWAELETVYGVPYYAYKADDSDLYHSSGENFSRWYPSIHMPREAARIFLRVTGVRAERLREIATMEAQQEGQPECTGDIMMCGGPDSCFDCEASYQNAIRWFSGVWDSTIKPADRATCGWDANPWVWVIEFERIEKELVK